VKDAGSELVGDAGWGWGEWSMEAAHVRSVSLLARIGDHVLSEASDIPGIVRLPMKRMEGVRSACTAAWRRTLVVNMVGVAMLWGFERKRVSRVVGRWVKLGGGRVDAQ
jgi:hypothetical protein